MSSVSLRLPSVIFVISSTVSGNSRCCDFDSGLWTVLSIRAKNAIRPERAAIEPEKEGNIFVNELSPKADYDIPSRLNL